MNSQIEQPLCMVCEEERETDEFGFPLIGFITKNL